MEIDGTRHSGRERRHRRIFTRSVGAKDGFPALVTQQEANDRLLESGSSADGNAQVQVRSGTPAPGQLLSYNLSPSVSKSRARCVDHSTLPDGGRWFPNVEGRLQIGRDHLVRI